MNGLMEERDGSSEAIDGSSRSSRLKAPMPAFVIVVWTAASAICGVVIWRWIISRRLRYRGLFPPLDQERVRYRDRAASGNSRRNLATKLGGASRALEVIVVDDELWIRTPYPWRLLFTGAEFDLEHRGRLSEIDRTEEIRRFLMGKGVRLTFRDSWGETKTVDLFVHDLEAFLAAIQIPAEHS